MIGSIRIQIFNFGIEIFLKDEEIITKIKKDFDYFLVNSLNKSKKTLTIKASQVENYKIDQKLIATKQTENSIYYDHGEIRYNDYYGKALTIFNYNDESVEVKYKTNNIAHELLYLLVLSRSGKYCDLHGYHKIHASAVSYNNKNLIYMMPSKGGKSTMLMELLRDEDVKIISDDTPVVNRWGRLYCFPLRIGHESDNKLFNYFPYLRDENLYEFKRSNYSKKFLVSTSELKNKIEVGEKAILVVGFRSTNENPELKKTSKLRMLKELQTHMIAGIGLPMIVEYFLQNSLIDHVRNSKILLSRILSSLFLLKKSDCYFLYTSSNTRDNSRKIMELLNEE